MYSNAITRAILGAVASQLHPIGNLSLISKSNLLYIIDVY